jgi:hypothetical protein
VGLGETLRESVPKVPVMVIVYVPVPVLLPLVDMVNVLFTLPFAGTVTGEVMPQLGPVTAQLTVTDPVNEPMEVRVIVAVADALLWGVGFG